MNGPKLVRIQAALDEISSRETDPERAIRRARALLIPEEPHHEVPYPVQALGPLASACEAIAEHAQLQPAMAGQCLLAAASLLTQGIVNVQTLDGIRPTSLFMLTLADSGEGKSSAQRIALAPLDRWQREQTRNCRAASSAHGATVRQDKTDQTQPQPPRPQLRLVQDATVEPPVSR